jgi:hypothetical protein
VTYVAEEYRPDRAYDEKAASTFVLPGGSLLVSLDRAFMTACAPYVYALWKENA